MWRESSLLLCTECIKATPFHTSPFSMFRAGWTLVNVSLWLNSWSGCTCAQCWSGVLQEEAVRVEVQRCSSTGTAPRVLGVCVCGLSTKRCFKIKPFVVHSRPQWRSLIKKGCELKFTKYDTSTFATGLRCLC